MIQELFNHPDFTIVNKPEGLSCHNDEVSLLQKYGNDWHLVNRIDRETSGLVVITKKGELQSALQLALAKGQKTYFAILRGFLPHSDEWLEWSFPISDKGEGRDTAQGNPADWKESKTLYKTIQSSAFFSAVECRLQSGRQHQIRKHSRLAGRPIVGDSRYGNPKDNSKISKMYNFNRMALHSWKLNFSWLANPIQCESTIPESFMTLLQE